MFEEFFLFVLKQEREDEDMVESKVSVFSSRCSTILISQRASFFFMKFFLFSLSYRESEWSKEN